VKKLLTFKQDELHRPMGGVSHVEFSKSIFLYSPFLFCFYNNAKIISYFKNKEFKMNMF
jgi:hypothetical protein